MSNYDLDRLGEKEFEHLVQALLKKIIGAGTITFGDGPDGGREATYSGKAPYPSEEERWDGEWVFQAKFHNTRQIGPDKARKEILNDLKIELEKITVKYKRTCDNFILANNVPLSSVPGLGTHDKIAQEIAPEFLENIPHIHVWGYDDISRFLDAYPDIRQTYLHLITPGDLIAGLMHETKGRKSALAEATRLYVCTSFEREQYAQLDQAGEIGEKPMPLRRVFVDLNVKPRSSRDLYAFMEDRPEIIKRFRRHNDDIPLSATEILISSDIPRTVLIGGPGQGKSTLGQFIAQIHRAYILQRVSELNGDSENLIPAAIRVPFRVSLRDYAQWIADNEPPHMLERFLATIVEDRAGRQISSEQIQEILKGNPAVLILDGLDEVTDRGLRARMLELLSEFIRRCEDVLNADVQIIATSRPTGYSNQFDPSNFLHLTLNTMDEEKVLDYTNRWIKTKGLEPGKGGFLLSTMKDCLADPHFSPLMTTPLQVTIFILIVLSGGTPPRQREELFNEYLEVIYKRERAKSKTIIQTEKRLLLGLHQYLGYLLHRRAEESSDTRSRMREKEFAKEVFRYLRHEDPYSNVDSLRAKAEQMIKEARERLVLLVELEPGFFGFELRSIQEFFAASYLAESANGDEQRLQRFLAISLPPHWDNVALFFAGKIARSFRGEAAHILEACREIDRHKPNYFAKRGAWLALEIAVDRSFGPNRILQRSAIEYAFTLLDTDLDRGKRSDFISNLRKLPKEDFCDHVEPLLGQLLQNIHLPGGFNKLEVYRSFVDETSSVEHVFTSAIEQKELDPERLLEKALEYRLPSQFIKSKFQEIITNLSQDRIIDLLFPIFIENTEYVVELWRDVGLLDSAAVSMFNLAIGGRFIWPPKPPIEVRVPIPADVIGQIELAWGLYSLFILEQYRSLFGKMHQDIEQRVSRNLHKSETLRKLEQIAGETSALIELRATALGVLAKVLFFTPQQGRLYEVYQRFLSSANHNQVELAERILYHMSAPSLYTSPGMRSRISLQEALYKVEKSYELGLLRVSILDALNTEQCTKIVGTKWCPKALLKRFSMDHLKVIVRLRIAPIRKKEPSLPLEFIAEILDIAAKILGQQGAEEWRAWAVLQSVASVRWSRSSGNLSSAVRKLEQAVLFLCEVLERRANSISGRWEIGGILSRCAEIGALRKSSNRFLNILAKMDDRIVSDLTSPVYWWNLNPTPVPRLLEIANDSDDLTFRGFLKYFAQFFRGSRTFPHRKSKKISRLQFNVNRLKSILQKAEGVTREGAIILLAHSRHISVEDAKNLLHFSRSDHKPVDRAWSELVKASSRASDDQDAIEFLEDILSTKATYPNAVRYGALEEYQRISRSTTIDIKAQERDLGLPFQEVDYI